jgi:hypothetical protein
MALSSEILPGKDSATSSRASLPIATQRPISGKLRPHPRHQPVVASIAQTFIQGDFIGWSVINIQRNPWSRMGKYGTLQGNKSLSCAERFL